MNCSSQKGLFPWVTILAGLVGFVLRSWLFSAVDSKGLLPTNHISGILIFILLALTLGMCLIGLKGIAPVATCQQLFPASPVAAAGILLGGVGLGLSAFTVEATGLLRIIMPVFAVLTVVVMAVAAYYRLKGLRPNFLLHCIVAAYLVSRIMVCCRGWSSEPQLQLYFFQLMAFLLLLLACYYRAELDVLPKSYRQYTFFSQAALFCCCLCLQDADRLFYLSAAIWMATDLCALPPAGKYAD